MTKNQLDQKLTSALQDFSEEIRSNYPEGSNTPATYGDINEVARQAFYVMDEFRRDILEYLK